MNVAPGRRARTVKTMANRRYAPRKKKQSILTAYLEGMPPFLYEWPAAPLPGGPAGHVVIEIPFPPGVKPESYNPKAGNHWGTERTEKVAWQHAACLAFREAEAILEPYRGHRILITVGIPFPVVRKRDGHNFTPTVLKPVCDGITKAGTLWKDDNTLWCMTAEPALWVGPQTALRCKIECAPIDPEDPLSW